MIELSSLVAALTLDNEQYRKALGESLDDGQSVVDQLGNLGGGIVTGIGVGAAAAAAGGVLLLTKAAEEAMAAEEVTAKLNATLANTSDVTGVTADMVDQLANNYQSLTRFEDDNIKAGGEVLARFDQINKDAFPDALKLSLDLAQRLGMDVPDAALLLGKALGDPGVGLMKLKAAGVVFNDENQKILDGMLKTGDQAGAMALIMNVVNESVGGAAEAAGKTAGGMWERLKNQWGNILELAGTGLLPMLMMLASVLMDYLNRPEVAAFVQSLADKIAVFAQQVITWIPQVVMWFQNAFGWLQQNQGVIVAALAVIGTAIAAWVYTVVIPAAIAAITAMAPLLLTMAAIAAVAYVVYEAWTNNWGGIRDTLTALWNGSLKPALTQLWNWLQVNIPAALQWLSNLWTNTLLPALTAVWQFLQTYVFPLLSAVANVIGAVLGKALQGVGAYLMNVWIPNFMKGFNWIRDNVLPVIQVLTTWLGTKLAPAFSGIANAISKVVSWLGTLANKISALHLPSWLTPGSPTPWENGLWGVQAALQSVAHTSLPDFQAAVALSPLAPAAGGIDLAPSSAAVSTATNNSGRGSEAGNDLLLKDVQRLLRDLPKEIARVNRDSSLRAAT